MNTKNILIISASFFPQNSPRSFRTTELAKEFARQGHNVTIYFPTEGRDYSSFEVANNVKVKNIGVLRWKGINLRGSGLFLLLRKVLRRGLQLLFEWPDIELMFKVAKILQHEKSFDLLISVASPYPIHWGVAKARTKTNKIAKLWIADCGDPFMGDTTDSFRKLFYFKYLENWFCRKADYITVPFEGARLGYYPEFQHKIKVIPQGFKLDAMNISEYKRGTNYPIFAYAGGFIPGKRELGNLLDFLKDCKREFKFIVYTSQTSTLLPFKQILMDKLEIREKIPREELLLVLSKMDFLINLDNNTKTQLPSKLIDYAISGRPVLNIASDTDFNVLLDFMDGNYTKKMHLDPPTRYDIQIIVKDFISLFSNS